MIKVVAKSNVKHDKIEEVLKLAKELAEITVKEEGCIKYEMYQDENDETILTMIEEWESRDALNKHMESEHFKRIVPMMGALREKSGEINIYKRVI
ncbi:putative quinol monooxygenase [Clostridium saccharobutylicum]|uniref:Antibiotic biosynthesis monooxygenase n=1 Tax=Clostridium saccharobutylicum DSM 13864 TaxID=1345695 RepID=U5MRW1_CLOSA|nr:putative quinol monooxygenase [Clostridium saccharobutylicum]AGX42177.1 antibiotic biosynthesis monooxygenase [Clostridium saccharobutylicum DSM 13864]AQR89457.1 putative monooxygenase YcnE [Clostridium saccharobutylicum]AQR99359.1 putative monooxygenase YcnE [Clostridium saccharobutylicum]AQS09090.1 putative monooxygenase YcnE [Clostridium saccharobutylicum]AQS13345.1 putative monooxygenase YcnE [Clostridium saccharobutylicum]